MRIFVTGGSGVLGRALLPRIPQHAVSAPSHSDLDLFDPAAVAAAVAGHDAVVHLATRIGGWDENDRLRADATRLLVDAALAAGAEVFLFPCVAFLDHPAVAARLESARVAEREVARFAAGGGRGIVLRLGLLWGPGTGNDRPDGRYGSTLQIDAAGEALADALEHTESGTYVVTDGR